MANKPVVGIIGQGRLGNTLTRMAIKAGYEVMVANSQEDAATLELQLSIMAPEAKVGTAEEVAKASDVVILAVPLHAYLTLQPDWFVGKTVVDAMNYWPPAEGRIEEFDGDKGSSEVIAAYLKGARVVKALNHIAYGELETDAGTRRAMVVAGDDKEAKEIIMRFIRDIGYDPVDLGGLVEGRRSQPDTTLFDTRYTASALPMT